MSGLLDPGDLWSILAPSPRSQIEEFKFSEKAEAQKISILFFFFASKYFDTFIDVLLC